MVGRACTGKRFLESLHEEEGGNLFVSEIVCVKLFIKKSLHARKNCDTRAVYVRGS